MKNSYSITPVTYADYIPMLKLYREFYEESHGKDIINFDADKTIEFLDELQDNPIHFSVKCELDDKVIGFFAGSISSMAFSSTPIGFERGFFVSKEYRGTRAATLLCDAWDAWAKAKGAVVTVDVIFHSEDNESTYSFMEKRGKRAVGKVFERIL